MEIILGVTEGSFHNDFSFEKSHLGYFLKILNVLPKEELKELQIAIHTIGNYIKQIPIEGILKLNKKGEYLLRGKALEMLEECYLKEQEKLKGAFTFFKEKKIVNDLSYPLQGKGEKSGGLFSKKAFLPVWASCVA